MVQCRAHLQKTLTSQIYLGSSKYIVRDSLESANRTTHQGGDKCAKMMHNRLQIVCDSAQSNRKQKEGREGYFSMTQITNSLERGRAIAANAATRSSAFVEWPDHRLRQYSSQCDAKRTESNNSFGERCHRSQADTRDASKSNRSHGGTAVNYLFHHYASTALTGRLQGAGKGQLKGREPSGCRIVSSTTPTSSPTPSPPPLERSLTPSTSASLLRSKSPRFRRLPHLDLNENNI